MAISWAQALGWRLGRHLLEPTGDESVAGVVGRLGGVPSKDEARAELVVRLRRSRSRPGEVAAALADGELVKAFTFRGGAHYLTPEDAGAYLAIRASGRQWELPSWREYYVLEPDDWPSFGAAVRDALADGPLTIRELGAAVTRRSAFRHLRPVFDDGAWTLVKALTWQGAMGFGPPRDGQPTFQRLDAAPGWAGVWDLDEAGPYAVAAYLRSYGPAPADALRYWLGSGLSAGRRIDRWVADLGDRVAVVDVEGDDAYLLAEDVDELRAAEPTEALRLLPGHDLWVMGPGTKDEHVVPAEHRPAATRGAHLVVVGGVVHGTWTVSGGTLTVSVRPQRGAVRRTQIEAQVEAEVARLGALLDRPLEPVVDTV